jgi:ligand-binding SRPBCC domain-containing protein
MSVYRLQDEIVIYAPLDEVWDFFTDPRNLKKITPEKMAFQDVYEPDAQKVYPGMLLVYKVSPLLGIPLTWITEITHVEPKKRFVDDQLEGPFGMWHHIHEFEEVDGGTLARDILYYSMPFGFLGTLVHSFTVAKQTKEIFKFRKAALEKLFPKK